MKRGISPLIATVLIIGFTIVLAAVVIRWGGDFLTGTTEESLEEGNFAQRTVKTNVEINSFMQLGHASVQLLLENTGEEDISDFTIRLTGETKTETIDGGVGELPVFTSKAFEIDLEDFEENVESIEVIPKLKTNDGDVSTEVIFDSSSGDSGFCGQPKIFVYYRWTGSKLKDDLVDLGYDVTDEAPGDDFVDLEGYDILVLFGGAGSPNFDILDYNDGINNAYDEGIGVLSQGNGDVGVGFNLYEVGIEITDQEKWNLITSACVHEICEDIIGDLELADTDTGFLISSLHTNAESVVDLTVGDKTEEEGVVVLEEAGKSWVHIHTRLDNVPEGEDKDALLVNSIKLLAKDITCS